MKVIYINTYRIIRFLLIAPISCILLLISTTFVVNAQDSGSDITLSFVKANDSLEVSSIYFNVLKIINSSSKVVSGNVTFNGPKNWKIITFPSGQTIINPGDTAWIPVRVSPDVNAIGGISYIVGGTFKTIERQISTNTYLTIPSVVKWEFTTKKNSIFFTENSTNAEFKYNLTNRGNTNELIKINYSIGKLLTISDNSSNEFVEFVDLPAFKDTVISHNVAYQKKLSYADKTRYENNWKESAIVATATTDKARKNSTILIKKLNSIYPNQRVQNSSPLNFDAQIYNLMSNQSARSNFKLYGSLLFSNNKEIQYVVGLQNINYGVGSNDHFEINRQLMYTLRYTDKKNNIEFGYNINNGVLHTINGRGLTGKYQIDRQSRLSYAITQNPYNLNVGQFVGYSSSLNNISYSTEVTHESSSNGNYDATSVLMSLGFPFLKYHSVTAQVLGSQSKYNLFSNNDTSVIGFSYKLDYNYKYKNLEMRVSGMSSAHNYIKNSGLQNLYIDGKYTLNNKIRFSLFGNRQYYSTTLYPYNFNHPANFNSTDYIRMTASLSGGNVIYQLGPNYNGSMRQYNNPITGFKSEYITYQPGLWGSATIKLNGYRTITPNVTVSNLRFFYNTNDPTSQNYSLKNNIYYSVGINYFDNIWRVNAYYTSGSTSDLYRSVQIDEQPTLSRSIQLRPSYENFFFERKVKLSAYVNYAYYMPSARENISYNVKYDHFLKNGWTVYISGFVYSNTRGDKQLGRITTKDLNFIAGFSKSFNIQQPRLKYYDFKTVFFNDLDGNRIKTVNEPPVSNILVNIEKDRSISTGKSNIPEIELLSDVNGSILVENLPKDNYKLRFNPLVNLQSLYFLNGSEQSYYNDKDKILFVPLAESYRIKGKIIVERDPNSSEGKIDLNSIRVIATGLKGENYSTLTDNSGSYILNVPNAEKFKVKVNNVFGEQFNIDNNEMEVQFTQNKTINLDFTFIETRRGINFENGNELFKFNSIQGTPDLAMNDSSSAEQSETTEIVESTAVQPSNLFAKVKKNSKLNQKENPKIPVLKPVKVKKSNAIITENEKSDSNLISKKSNLTKLKKINNITPSDTLNAGFDKSLIPKMTQSEIEKLKPNENIKVVSVQSDIEELEDQNLPLYVIQLDALRNYLDPELYKEKYNLKDEILFVEEDGLYKYYTGNYKTIDEAKSDLARLGMAGYIISYDRLKRSSTLKKGISYSIQLDALTKIADPAIYKKKYNFTQDVTFTKQGGKYIYFTGSYSTLEEAKDEMNKLGINGFVVKIGKSEPEK